MGRKKYKLIGLGGSFDHFHAGHAAFLQFAAEWADHLLIGVTNEKLIQHKKFSYSIEDYWTRAHSVKEFCGRHHINYHVVQLNDAYGPTLEGTQVEALAVSDETIPGANKINDVRQKMDLRQLPVYICPLVTDEAGQVLHAERIRAGEVSRSGQVYAQVLEKDVTLSDTQRQFFSQPQGEVIAIDNISEPPTAHQAPVCVVGDSSLEAFITKKWPFTLGVYDHIRQRQPYHSPIIDNLKSHAQVKNEAGHISPALVQALQKSLTKSGQLLEVAGEEDLATVALFMLLPLQSYIFYGQPHQGVVRVTVTEELKQAAYQVLKNP